jgi:hypothetical protein
MADEVAKKVKREGRPIDGIAQPGAIPRGAFSASYTINADVILTAPGGDPTNPTQVVAHFADASFTESISGTWHPPNPCIPGTGPGTGVCDSGGFTIESLTVTAGPLAWSPAVVPEPGTGLLVLGGMLGLAVVRRRHNFAARATQNAPTPPFCVPCSKLFDLFLCVTRYKV